MDDLVQSAIQAVEENKSVRRGAMLTYGICAFLIGSVLFATFTKYGISLAAVLCGAASCGVFLLAFPLVLRRSVKKRAVAMAKKNSKVLLEQRGFSLTQKGLRLWGSTFDKIYPYETMLAVREQKSYLSVVFQKEGIVSLPLRAFSSPGDQQEFLRQLREKVPETKR